MPTKTNKNQGGSVVSARKNVHHSPKKKVEDEGQNIRKPSTGQKQSLNRKGSEEYSISEPTGVPKEYIKPNYEDLESESNTGQIFSY